MNWPTPAIFHRLGRDRRGSVALATGVAIVALFGVAAIAVDIGHVLSAKGQLQFSADAAALAGARVIGSGVDPVSTARSYSSVAGQRNAFANLAVAMANGYPALKCLTTTGVTCTGSPSANAIVVKQQASVPTYFAKVLGIDSVDISTTATAGAKGGASTPVDAIIIVDTTLSMSQTKDSSCKGYDQYTPSTPYKIDCALAGVRALISGFWPTSDQVGLMVFPGVQSGTEKYDYSCGNTGPTVLPYSPTPSYQVLPLANTYRASDTSALDAGDPLVIAAHGGCKPGGIKVVGGEGTYYADVIAAAQTALTRNGRPSVQKAIVLLSDGDANAQQPSEISNAKQANQCRQAVTAARAAASAGFWVYSVAYGASASGCSTDTNLTPCQAMQQVASDASKFFADSSSSCPKGSSPNPTSGLVNIFQNIGTDLTSARLLPDSTN
jgi:Flp pilus assembly protein TadG